MKVTLSREAHATLERARDLLRLQIPNGDPAAIVERALAVLVDQLEKTKHASTERPRANAVTASTSRRVPAAVKRAVWTRDAGRCAFVGADGRCRETGCLEFHHVVAFAAGGPTSIENLQLRCRAHNVYEAALSGQSWPSTPGQIRSCRVDQGQAQIAAVQPDHEAAAGKRLQAMALARDKPCPSTCRSSST